MADFTTAHASMNHVAFDVPREKLEEYQAKLQAKGVPCSIIFDHDDSPIGIGTTFESSAARASSVMTFDRWAMHEPCRATITSTSTTRRRSRPMEKTSPGAMARHGRIDSNRRLIVLRLPGA